MNAAAAGRKTLDTNVGVVLGRIITNILRNK